MRKLANLGVKPQKKKLKPQTKRFCSLVCFVFSCHTLLKLVHLSVDFLFRANGGGKGKVETSEPHLYVSFLFANFFEGSGEKERVCRGSLSFVLPPLVGNNIYSILSEILLLS